MAAIAHTTSPSRRADEILRSADELKKAVSDANVGDKIPALDRSALDTQQWRSVVLECNHRARVCFWRLLRKGGYGDFETLIARPGDNTA